MMEVRAALGYEVSIDERREIEAWARSHAEVRSITVGREAVIIYVNRPHDVGSVLEPRSGRTLTAQLDAACARISPT